MSEESAVDKSEDYLESEEGLAENVHPDVCENVDPKENEQNV